jgi:ribonucleoside-diphosphate reductase alpha chain
MSTATKTQYSYDQVLKETIAYFHGDELAATTWINKYCLRDNQNELLESNPDHMHHRLAREFARIERNYEISPAKRDKLSIYGRQRNFLSEEVIYQLFRKFKYVISQ